MGLPDGSSDIQSGFNLGPSACTTIPPYRSNIDLHATDMEQDRCFVIIVVVVVIIPPRPSSARSSLLSQQQASQAQIQDLTVAAQEGLALRGEVSRLKMELGLTVQSQREASRRVAVSVTAARMHRGTNTGHVAAFCPCAFSNRHFLVQSCLLLRCRSSRQRT